MDQRTKITAIVVGTLIVLGLAYLVVDRFFIEPSHVQEGVVAMKNGDYQRAVRILTPYAEHGNKTARLTLGYAYAFGLGVEKNRSKAVELLKNSTQDKTAEMYFSVARSYEKGEGVARNEAEVLAWYKIAAEAGSNAAWVRLQELTSTNK